MNRNGLWTVKDIRRAARVNTQHAWRRRLGLAQAYFTRKPVWCAWQVTYRCNMRCGFCNYWAIKTKPSDELTLEQIELGARNIANFGSLMVSIAGGEPTLREDLPEIIEVLARYHIPFMTTNGWHVTRNLAHTLFRKGLWGVSVSIDYADPEKHNAQRGRAGAFERAVNALRLFAEERIRAYQRVNLMMVLTRDNADQVEPLAQLAKDLGVWFMVQPYCIMKTGDASYLAEPGISRKLIELKRRYPCFVSNTKFLERFDEALTHGVANCSAGRAFFNIDNYGNVAICVEHRNRPVGNILTDPAETLLERLHAVHADNECTACWYNCRGEVESLYDFHGVLHSLPIYLGVRR